MEESHASDTNDGIDYVSTITSPPTADVTTTPIPKQRMASSDEYTMSTSSPSDVATTPIPPAKRKQHMLIEYRIVMRNKSSEWLD